MTNIHYPVVPIRDIVLLPSMIAPLFIGRKKTLAAVDYAVENNLDVVVLAQKDAEKESPRQKDLYDVGCVAKILQVLRIPDGTVKILVEGTHRVKINKVVAQGNYLKADAEVMYSNCDDMPENLKKPLLRSMMSEFDNYANKSEDVTTDMIISLRGLDDPSVFADAITIHLPISIAEKQQILSETNIEDKVSKVLGFLHREVKWSDLDSKIKNKVQREIKEEQIKYYKMKKFEAFKKELSSSNIDGEDDLDQLEKNILALGLKGDTKDKILTELNKLKNMPPMSAESTVVRNYLDWIVDLPWNKVKKSKTTLQEAENILNSDHFGLQEVKDRILEFLAVQLHVKIVKGPILCLVGPPGVGKTSLGRSIASAMDRKFVRISLGGVRDEAEIRGHRKTYIGAMPGKIIKAMKRAKVSNPLILLDEIDKMGMDFRGDPASALLEVLDKEQNSSFSDHYLEVDYDVSNALFITTANSLNIPAALLDRLEIIRIPGYTENEKLNISKNFLLPKTLHDVGLKQHDIKISDAALRDIIRYYTKESGVRELERSMNKICRKVIRINSDNKNKKTNINTLSLEKYLGVRQYKFGVANSESKVGIVRGMAWTEVGGELLTIETIVFPGKGNTIYTGSLGDVMKESIQAALSIVRCRAKSLGIPESFYNKNDIHIHVPEGATPKDGPSAGVGMCLGLVSSLTKVPVKSNFALTGEITLSGEIIAIGGLKEKLLAALRGVITEVIIPSENGKDLTELPKEVLDGIIIHQVSWIDEVLDLALDNRHKKVTQKKRMPDDVEVGATIIDKNLIKNSPNHTKNLAK